MLSGVVTHLRRVAWIEDWRTRPGHMSAAAQRALEQLVDTNFAAAT